MLEKYLWKGRREVYRGSKQEERRKMDREGGRTRIRQEGQSEGWTAILFH